MFANQNVAGWLLACDVAEPVKDTTQPSEQLEEVIEHMKLYDMESIPVIEATDDYKFVGMLDLRKTVRRISAEVLRRRQKADEMQLTGLEI
jgi:hypothetical protein